MTSDRPPEGGQHGTPDPREINGIRRAMERSHQGGRPEAAAYENTGYEPDEIRAAMNRPKNNNQDRHMAECKR